MAVENELNNQFLSPYKATLHTSRQEAIEILQSVIPLAIEKLDNQAIVDQVSSHDDLLIFFDSLVADYTYLKFNINIEEFKAIVSKYDLLKSEEIAPLYQQIVDAVVRISPNIEEGATEWLISQSGTQLRHKNPVFICVWNQLYF